MKLDVQLDATGFPLVRVEDSNFYIHWLPVTKIQIEYFLSSGKISRFDASWYDSVMLYNERVSPGQITSRNYWQSFVTGILPDEARSFGSWLQGYDLPTKDEWQAAYKLFRKEKYDSATSEQIANTPGINLRGALIIRNISACLNEIEYKPDGGLKLCDQMLMRLGLMEYVYLDPTLRNSYGGFGETNSTFFGSFESPDKGYPQQLSNPQEGTRMRHYGFRLVLRMKE